MSETTPLMESKRHLKRAASSVAKRGMVAFKDEHIDMDGSLKAAVFGFNDGLCANTCLMIGIASASSIDPSVVVASGLVGLFAGAASMGAGEWVSLSLQNRAEAGEIAKEREHLETQGAAEDQNFNDVLRDLGFSERTIDSLQQDMNTGKRDTDLALKLRLHAKLELNLDVDEERGNPLKSMGFMMSSFSLGAVIPLIPWIPFLYMGPVIALFLSMVAALLASFVAGYMMSGFTDESGYRTGMRQVYAASLAIAGVYGTGLLYQMMGGSASAALG
eukprot:TRINITY_DN2033_c2_g1_i1.p1 TRINITY_DN2033_c2_g1~~TRINITY_DN2033_c2_g1_i1.p1  ORF type:complete len:290 (+),score=82.35 TRINITY_DN2033_c2_g1_i1:47-871(+)